MNLKKKIALLTICLFSISTLALAAPLTDYRTGKISLDLNFRSTKNTIDIGGDGLKFDNRYNIEPSVTVGIADKWALQYRNLNSKSKTTNVGFKGINVETSKLQINEFNALYSLTPQVSAFVGYVNTKASLSYGGLSDKRNTWQLGLLTNVPLTDSFSAYGILGAGNKWLNYELGLSYAFIEDFEFNINYRYVKAEDFDYNADATTKGLGFGVTCKFF